MMTTTEKETTESILQAMLTENTGTNFMDSGGDSGRMWQRNQGRDFSKEVTTKLEFDGRDVSVTHNVYHWLLNIVDYDEKLQAIFDEFVKENPDNGDYSNLEEFDDYISEHYRIECGGIYGEGEPFTTNTYNGEDSLSQTLQHKYINIESTDDRIESGVYIVLQIHGGADVRGGYTSPKVFKLKDYNDGTEIFENARAWVSCSGKPADADPNQTYFKDMKPGEPATHNWDTEEGYHFWNENGLTDLDLQEANQVTVKDANALNDEERAEISEFTEGTVLLVDEKGVGHCPLCNGELDACF